MKLLKMVQIFSKYSQNFFHWRNLVGMIAPAEHNVSAAIDH